MAVRHSHISCCPDSPAIDTGDPNFTPPPFFDQRGLGFDRVVDGRIDKGSFELQVGNDADANTYSDADANYDSDKHSAA